MDAEKCTGCERCVAVCKVGAASVGDGKAVIDYDKVHHLRPMSSELPRGGPVLRRGRLHALRRGSRKLAPYDGWILRDFVGREEILPLLGWVLEVFRSRANPGIRLREFIKTIGFEDFRRRVTSADPDQGR
jgi:coenzyme F420 hydrogenase subunit beta